MAIATQVSKRKSQEESNSAQNADSVTKKQKVIPEPAHHDDSSSSDEDFGPSLPAARPLKPSSKSHGPASSENKSELSTGKSHGRKKGSAKKRQDVALANSIFLDELPDFPFYNLSFAHKEQVTIVRTYQYLTQDTESSVPSGNPKKATGGGASKLSEFLVTGSKDGRIVFWNKMKSLASTAGSAGIAGQALNDTIGRIEFIKEFKAHRGPVVDAVLSADGRYLATISGATPASESPDTTIKIFDVINFDMIHFVELPKLPACVCWGSAAKSSSVPKLLVGLQNDTNIYIHDLSLDAPDKPKSVLSHLHKQPIKSIVYNDVFGVALSVDSVGMVEYWSPEPASSNSFGKPAAKTQDPFTRPTGDGWFDLKSATNLYDFRKKKCVPTTISLSPNGKYFAAFSLPDRKVRVFDFKSGKLFREYDESLETIEDFRRLESVGKGVEMEKEKQNKTISNDAKSLEKMDGAAFDKKMERDRRLVSKEYSQEIGIDITRYMNVLFDVMSRFIIYSSPTGIKFVNIHTNKLVRTLGAGEHDKRFINLALYQGFNRPSDAGKLTVEALASDNVLIQKSLVPDPVLFATAMDSSRFYLFSRIREVDDSNEDDITNEKNGTDTSNGISEIVNGVKLRMPKNVRQWLKDRSEPSRPGASADARDSPSSSATAEKVEKEVPEALKVRAATIHTTLGDIRLKFYPNVAPLAVENFVTLARRGYYDGTIFHRVIKKFMIQGGDPEGTGSGGESMWADARFAKSHRGPTGGTWGQVHFADEVDPSGELSHKRAMVLSMANAGPGTNGSQFFITTAPAPWLDGKHTIFGAVTMGADTIQTIENVQVGKNDRPVEPPEIVSITIE